MSQNRTVLATAFFDGQPSRQPIQSFSATNSSNGADSRDALLRQLHEDRQKRESERRRTQAVYKIQRFWRRQNAWRKLKMEYRVAFDEQVGKDTNRARIETQIRRLLLFFNPAVDGERLIWVCQHIVKSVTKGDRYSSVLMRLLLLCCLRYLKYAAPKDQNSSNITMPFRCLEVILLSDRNIEGTERWENLVLLDRLIRSGFYEVLRSLFDYRTPSYDLIAEQIKPPTYQAESFMNAMVRPLTLFQSARTVFPEREVQITDMMSLAWLELVRCFFAKPAMSPIVRFYVIPSFATKTDVLSLNDLASYVIDKQRGSSNVYPYCKTPEFAHTLAYFASKFGLSNMDSHFMTVYATVSQSLLEISPQQSNRGLDDESEGRGSPMEVDEPGENRRWILSEWLNFNHDKTLVSFLTQIAAVEGANETLTTCLIELCRIHWSTELFGGQHCKFLQMLAYQPNLIRQLWQSITSCTTPSIMGPPRPLIEQLQIGSAMTPEDRRRLIPLLSVFCALFSTTLAAANDEDFFHDLNLKSSSSTVPFSRSTLAMLSCILRDVALGLIQLALPDSRPIVSEQYRAALTTMGVDFSRQDTTEWNQLFEAVVRLLQLLHDRDERLQFCPIGSWGVKNRITLQHVKLFRSDHPNTRRQRHLFNLPRYLTRQELEDEKTFVQSSAELRHMTILRRLPFVVPFEQRVELLYQLIMNDQQEHGRQGFWQHGHLVSARRNYLYEDAFDKLSQENVPDLRQRIRVKLENWAGAVEAGVDGGGLFREFLNELLKAGFDPQRGFFVATSHDSALYPNPLAPKLFADSEYRRHYYFLGRMVGKLMYENQLAELRFSRFFLARLLRPSSEVDVHHLAYYDPLLYKNLIRLKNEDDVSSLDLDFSLTVEELGEVRIVELQQNGTNIPVTNANRLEYIEAVAKYYLNHQIKGQTDAFRAGLSDLIDLDWLQMFDYRELQVLISGADRDIDVIDLQNNTTYCGDVVKEGDELDPYIKQFWVIVQSFTEEQKKKLLKFVTSCSRPPLLGFKDLHPPFCIQVSKLREGEQDRLPTAATCSNLLKLPRFHDVAILRQKLIYAIESAAGFELS